MLLFYYIYCNLVTFSPLLRSGILFDVWCFRFISSPFFWHFEKNGGLGVICVFGSSVVLLWYWWAVPNLASSRLRCLLLAQSRWFCLYFVHPCLRNIWKRIALWQPKLSLYCVLSAVCTVWTTCRRMEIVGIKPWQSICGGVCHCLARGSFW